MQKIKPNLEELVRLARELSPLDKVRLIEHLAPDVEAALVQHEPAPVERRSLRGILKGCNISDQDIEEIRREMWGGFPREDL